MAGGVKRPVNIFRLKALGEPKGVFNWRLWFASLSFGLLGAARGIDEGLISGAFSSKTYQAAIHYDSYTVVGRANLQANVSAMLQLGCIPGAIIAFIVCDRIGRVWATRLLCALWMIGIAISMIGGTYGNLGAIYAGRFIAGLGVGQTTVVGPVYIAEISPASVRGLCTCFFTGAVYIGVLVATFANYGAQHHINNNNPNQWLVPTSLHVIFSGIVFTLSFFQAESPRFLIKQGQIERAAQVMAHLRQQPVNSDYVTSEIAAIRLSLEHEIEATHGVGFWAKVKEMFLDKGNAYRVYLASMVQLLSQWSGAGSIVLYAPNLFRLVGIKTQQESLLVTAILSVAKLLAGVACCLFLVDVIGRKRSLLIGITLQFIAMVYVAAFLTKNAQLGIVKGYSLPNSEEGASIGAIAMFFLSGIGWALGWNSMQYLLTAELFPLRIRALATSWAMTLHFANQYGNSRAVPNMLLATAHGGITPKGTFWCFAAVILLGGIWVWLSIPETSGRSLESMDRLFDLPWYKIGLHGNEDAEIQDAAAENNGEKTAEEEQIDKEIVEQIEKVDIRHHC